MKKENKKVSLIIESKFEHVSMVGLSTRGICSSLQLTSEDQFFVELAVCEALNNIIEHGYRGNKGRYIYTNILLDKASIAFQIKDNGRSFDPKEKLQETKQVSADDWQTLPERGRGLEIIDSVMDEWDYQPGLAGFNLLTMKKYLGT
jgi:serine/threonine-protein kinase RsbW